jgi:predicted DNA-binding ribbon-helix-helix protein
MWEALQEIAARRSCTVNALVSRIDATRTGLSLTSAIRVLVVEFYRDQVLGQENDTPARENGGTPLRIGSSLGAEATPFAIADLLAPYELNG